MKPFGQPDLPPNERAFLSAVKSGDIVKVQELLAKGVPVDVRDVGDTPWDQTALMYAAENGHLDIVRFLLKAGANVSAKDKGHREVGGGEQPLHYAMRGKNLAIAEELLAAGAKPNVWDIFGNSPLNVAIDQDNIEAVKLLLKHGADLNAKPRTKAYDPPLNVAIREKKLVIFQLLLEAGADVNAVNQLNMTPLFSAASATDGLADRMVEALLKAGAKVDHLDRDGETALSSAVYSRRGSVVRKLAEAGADVNRVFHSQGGTLLDAVEKRIRTNQEDVTETSPAWLLESAKKGVQEWQEMFDVLRELGAKRQSEL